MSPINKTPLLTDFANQQDSQVEPNDIFRHVHIDGSIETAVGREQAIRLCPELGRIASRDPEMANSLLDISNIEIPDLDIDTLLAEKFERNDKAEALEKIDTRETIDIEQKENITSTEDHAQVNDNQLETEVISTQLAVARNTLNKVFYDQQQKQQNIKVLAEQPEAFVAKKTQKTNINRYKQNKPDLVVKRENTNITTNSSVVDAKQFTDLVGSQDPEIHDDSLSKSAVRAKNRQDSETKKTNDIDVVEFPVLSVADAQPVESIEAATDEPARENFDLLTESLNLKTDVTEFLELETEQDSNENSFESFIDIQPEIEIETINELQLIANEQPIEQTFYQFIIVQDKEAPEYKDVAELIQEISQMFEELAVNQENEAIITPEVVNNILQLLSVLGYEKPEEALVDLVNRRNLEFLIQSIKFMSQNIFVYEQQEFLTSSKTILSNNNLPGLIGEFALSLLGVIKFNTSLA